MLYITTRDNKDAFTAHHALTENFAQDGGRYIPYHIPQFSTEDLKILAAKPFGQIVAEILNAFFSSRLTGWDVDCCVGRNCTRVVAIHHKIAVAELWHNPQADYGYLVNSLYSAVTSLSAADTQPSEWFKIAVRIAIIFALYGELVKRQILSGEETFDISVPVNDFVEPIAAYYAYKMGLPVNKIICSGLENSSIWDFIQRGALSSISMEKSLYPGVERLIQATLGHAFVGVFVDKIQRRQSFAIDDIQHECIRNSFFCSVIGADRIRSIISSVYRSTSYVVDPDSALCHGGLQDYRAKTGNSKTTLIFAEKSPLCAVEQISSAIGIDTDKLTDHINLS